MTTKSLTRMVRSLNPNRHVAVVLMLLAAAALGACSSSRKTTPYDPISQADRRPEEAERLNLRAADLLEKTPEEAEHLLRDALAADLYCGPAHNNLGVLYLKQGKLYEAAGEFEWARKLLPGHPDPRLNLALTLERAGRTDDALKQYETALEVYPDHLPTLQAISRLMVRSNKQDARTRAFLEEISMRGESDAWRSWARLQLAKSAR